MFSGMPRPGRWYKRRHLASVCLFTWLPLICRAPARRLSRVLTRNHAGHAGEVAECQLWGSSQSQITKPAPGRGRTGFSQPAVIESRG